jgi:hypothetical protein
LPDDYPDLQTLIDVYVVMLIQLDEDDHLFFFHVDVNVDLLYYYHVFLHQYVVVYDYFQYFHLYFVYEIHSHQKNVCDLQQLNANVVVYVILNDFFQYIS